MHASFQRVALVATKNLWMSFEKEFHWIFSKGFDVSLFDGIFPTRVVFLDISTSNSSHWNWSYWEKIEKRFSIFEFRLGINFFHFRLGSFGKVEERLGSPVAGVEIDTGWKRELFYTFWNKAERCRTNTFRVMNFLIFFYFRMQMESWSKFEKQA